MPCPRPSCKAYWWPRHLLPPASAAPARTSHFVKIIPRTFDAGRLIAPREFPKNIAPVKEDELPPPSPDGGVGGLAGGAKSGVPFGILGPVPTAVPPPPPLVEKKAPPRIQVGGILQSAKLLRQAKPVYPELAKKARIQGVVKLHALISKGGTIEDLKVVSGHPLLVSSALEAVRQWVYQPTLLNGETVGVETEIDVNFILSP